MGLQELESTCASYDLIWMQWVVVHTKDLDLVHYPKRCEKALTPNGFTVIHENLFTVHSRATSIGKTAASRALEASFNRLVSRCF